MSGSRNGIIREKWLDEVEIELGQVNQETASAIGRHVLLGGLSVLPGLIEIPTTNFEQSAMGALADALNLARDKCSLKPIRIPSDRLHIVQTDQFRQEIGQANGFEMLGHAYLPESQRSKPEHFAYSLSHEMAHLSSFVSVWVQLEGQGQHGRVVEVRQTRTGLQRLGQTGHPEFNGLNEAVTEYVAMLLRREVSTGLGSFAQQCAVTKNQLRAYTGVSSLVIALTRQLVALAVKSEWTAVTEVWRDLLIDYWIGSDTFLDALAAWNGALLDDFRQLGTNHEDATSTALKYGLQLTNQE